MLSYERFVHPENRVQQITLEVRRKRGGVSLKLSVFSPSSTLIRELYARMLLTRIVDEYACKLREQGKIGFVASSCGHEAAQVGSAVCIELGKDFTLPYYRDLGVVLTIGMAPYEVFRTYLQAHMQQEDSEHRKRLNIKGSQAMYHWGYHKHNMVTGPAPVATQILHAAGIAFASKLRKVPVVTIAYCGRLGRCPTARKPEWHSPMEACRPCRAPMSTDPPRW